MKQNNRQTSPFGRSTKADNAGLSLLRPRLFEVIGDTYNYFNAIIQNTFKAMSPFLQRLTQKKFSMNICECFYAFGYLHPEAKEAMRFHFETFGTTRKYF